MIINDVIFPEKDLNKIPAAMKAAIINPPPITSLFHAMISKAINTKTGILFIKKANILFANVAFPSNVSNENNSMNKIVKITRIRGVHCRIFEIIA